MNNQFENNVNKSMSDAAKLIGKQGGLKGGRSRWSGRTVEEKAAFGRMMAEAKKAKRLKPHNDDPSSVHAKESDEAKHILYVKQAIEFHRAVEILADEFGRDIRDLILDRHVDLTDAQLLQLAEIIQRSPGGFPQVGEFIRAANTKMVKAFIGGNARGKE